MTHKHTHTLTDPAGWTMKPKEWPADASRLDCLCCLARRNTLGGGSYWLTCLCAFSRVCACVRVRARVCEPDNTQMAKRLQNAVHHRRETQVPWPCVAQPHIICCGNTPWTPQPWAAYTHPLLPFSTHPYKGSAAHGGSPFFSRLFGGTRTVDNCVVHDCFEADTDWEQDRVNLTTALMAGIV